MFALTMAVDPGPLLLETLGEKRITQDEAWREMGFTDGAQFSRAVHGERPLDERRLMCLQFEVWLAYISRLIAARAADFGMELLADRKRMAKAGLTADRKERVS